MNLFFGYKSGWKAESSHLGYWYCSNRELGLQEDVFVMDDFGTLVRVPVLGQLFHSVFGLVNTYRG